MTHAPARGTTYQHDEAGSITRIVDPLGSVTRQTFDALGRLASRALPNGATSTWPPSEVLYEYDSSLRFTREYHRSRVAEITQNLTNVYGPAAGGAVGATDAFLRGALDCTRRKQSLETPFERLYGTPPAARADPIVPTAHACWCGPFPWPWNSTYWPAARSGSRNGEPPGRQFSKRSACSSHCGDLDA